MNQISTVIADRMEMAKSLLGVIPSDITVEEAQEERIFKI